MVPHVIYTGGVEPLIVPVGFAFELVYEDTQAGTNPPVTHAMLYWSQADDSHPSIQGTYLVACLFYGALWEQTPVGTAWTPLLVPAEQATYLQNVAARALGMVRGGH